MELKDIKLLIIDIDGVMTDGTKIYGQDGLPYAKKYNDKDFTAIKRFRASGVQICFLSGDDNVNKAMAENRNIPFYSARGKDKKDFIPILEKDFGVSKEKMAYVGDDYFDLSIMKEVAVVFWPADAIDDIWDFYYTEGCSYIRNKGGEGVIAELYCFFLESGCKKASDKEIIKLDRDEKF